MRLKSIMLLSAFVSLLFGPAVPTFAAEPHQQGDGCFGPSSFIDLMANLSIFGQPLFTPMDGVGKTVINATDAQQFQMLVTKDVDAEWVAHAFGTQAKTIEELWQELGKQGNNLNLAIHDVQGGKMLIVKGNKSYKPPCPPPPAAAGASFPKMDMPTARQAMNNITIQQPSSQMPDVPYWIYLIGLGVVCAIALMLFVPRLRRPVAKTASVSLMIVGLLISLTPSRVQAAPSVPSLSGSNKCNGPDFDTVHDRLYDLQNDINLEVERAGAAGLLGNATALDFKVTDVTLESVSKAFQVNATSLEGLEATLKGMGVHVFQIGQLNEAGLIVGLGIHMTRDDFDPCPPPPALPSLVSEAKYFSPPPWFIVIQNFHLGYEVALIAGVSVIVTVVVWFRRRRQQSMDNGQVANPA